MRRKYEKFLIISLFLCTVEDTLNNNTFPLEERPTLEDPSFSEGEVMNYGNSICKRKKKMVLMKWQTGDLKNKRAREKKNYYNIPL